MSILIEINKNVWEFSLKNGVKKHEKSTILLINQQLEEVLEIKYRDNETTLKELLNDEEKLMSVASMYGAYHGRWNNERNPGDEMARNLATQPLR